MACGDIMRELLPPPVFTYVDDDGADESHVNCDGATAGGGADGAAAGGGGADGAGEFGNNGVLLSL